MPYTLRFVFIVMGIDFAGFCILTALGYEWLFLPFSILLLIAIIPLSFAKPRFKTHQDNVSIPAKYIHFEDELFALGFELDCLVDVTYFFLPTRQRIYCHREERVEAYISESSGRLWFSSYFEKHFDVTTRFQHGVVLNNKKIVSEIVKTSISAAFDYHLQHRQKYTQQYGAIMLFENAEQQIEWELKQNVDSEIKREAGKGCLKFIGRFAIALVALFILFLAFAFVLMAILFVTGSSREEALAFYMLWAIPFFIIGFLVALFWSSWPTIFPKTVEDRKGKKLEA